jgi:amino acid adenylation domain-containing protein/FkbM family methyltransferase
MQKVTIEGYKLSPQQEQLWLMQQASETMPVRATCAMLIGGDLNADILKSALCKVVDRHEILRTVIEYIPKISSPLQVITDRSVDIVGGAELKGPGKRRLREKIEAELKRMGEGNGEDSIVKARLIPLKQNKHILLLSLPSLCTDTLSLNILLAEIAQSYESLLTGGKVEEEPAQYADVSQSLNELLELDEAELGREYWRGQNIPAPCKLKLPFDEPASPPLGFEPRVLTRKIPTPTLSKIDQLFGKHEDPRFVFLQACWQIMLWRHAVSENLVTACSFDGRTYEMFERSLGLFEKYLPFPCVFNGQTKLSEILDEIEARTVKAVEWQEYFNWERNTIPEASATEPPYFQFCFDYRKLPARFYQAELSWSLFRPYSCTDRFDLKLSCVATGKSLTAEFHYDSSRFSREAIEQFSDRYLKLLESAINNRQSVIEELEIISDAELRQVVAVFNQTERNYPVQLLQKYFQETVEFYPQAVAVAFNDEQLTYAELNRRANRLAQLLLSRGAAGPDRIIAICLERSIEMVVAVLGVLKSGSAYVPIEPTYPQQRIRYILKDCQASVVLCDSRLQAQLEHMEIESLCLDADNELLPVDEQENPAVEMCPENLAYVIYTSGTTGKPKGVMISHRSIGNRLMWMKSELEFAEREIVLQKTSFSFDASVWEILLPLISGWKLVMAEPGGHQDVAYLVNEISRQQVTTLQLVPSMMRALVEEEGLAQCGSLGRIFCGGELLIGEDQKKLKRRLDVKLHNLYGPTETSIDATHWECENVYNGGVIPIGRAIGNAHIYILDQQRRAVGVGMEGEIYIGGVGLARGYLGKADQTAERFLPHPYDKRIGGRVYRSGDIGRYRDKGIIEYVRRADDQVKIRGNRVELREIESVLREHEGVSEAVVVIREDQPGDQRLTAYVVEHSRPASDHQLYRLRNGLEILQINRNETEMIYEEIFEQESYLRGGIRIEEGDCILDIGANIGLFTLFVYDRVKNATVYSFEPIKAVYEVLRENVEMYKLDAKAINCGVSNRIGQARFTFYRKAAATSGMYADEQEERRVTREVINRQGKTVIERAEELLEGRYDAELEECRLTTVSEAIREEGIEKIDLLKIDVEKSERDVLEGIEEGDWAKIKQIAIEVHDISARVEGIRRELEERGYEVTIEQEEVLEGTGIYNLYGVSRIEIERRKRKREKRVVNGARLLKRGIEEAEIRDYLSKRLPQYMWPSAIVKLERMPMTTSGKIDRRILPAPETIKEQRREKRKVKGEIEEILASIWGEVLAIEEMAADDNFFDLGGHSLLALQVGSRVRKAFEVELSVRKMFENATIEEMAHCIRQELRKEKWEVPPLVKTSREGRLPLSFAQQRMWIIDQLDPGNAAYNISGAVRLEGELDIGGLESAINEIVRRHEILRTRIEVEASEPVQVIDEWQYRRLEVEDMTGSSQEHREAVVRRIMREEAGTGFDIRRGPLLRVKVIKLEVEQHVLLYTMHHIISDGWSTGVLIREIGTLYQVYSTGRAGEGSPLEELPIQYADYAVWQREWLKGDVLEEGLNYWRKKLAGVEALELPTDHPRSAVPSYRGAAQTFLLEPELSAALRKLSKQEGMTLFMTLLAAFQTLLYRSTGHEDIVVGTPVANRNRLELEGLIGFFVNTLALRNQLSADISFRGLLHQVRETALAAYSHDQVPFEKLVAELSPKRAAGQNPLFQTWFFLDNGISSNDQIFPGIISSSVKSDLLHARMDIALTMTANSDTIAGTFTYATDLFEHKTITILIEQFRSLLQAVVENPDCKLQDISLATLKKTHSPTTVDEMQASFVF